MNRLFSILLALVVAFCASGRPTLAAPQDPKQLAHDIFKELVEIDTTDSAGNVSAASEAVAHRLRLAGFDEKDIHVAGARDSKRNLVLRYHGSGKRAPYCSSAIWTLWKPAARTGRVLRCERHQSAWQG